MGYLYVVGDIHGCAKTFKELIFNVIKLSKDDELYLLGDYIDRGPDSKGVIDTILKLKSDGFKVHPLRGNHEQFLLDASLSLAHHEFWLKNGGLQTLESFNALSIFEIPSTYLDFFQALPYYYEIEGFYLVHAGFNFKGGKPFEDFQSMMMIRNFPVDKSFIGNKKIFHGHTPLPIYQIKRDLKDIESTTYNLDNGCVYKTVSGMGGLLAMELRNWKLFVQPNVD